MNRRQILKFGGLTGIGILTGAPLLKARAGQSSYSPKSFFSSSQEIDWNQIRNEFNLLDRSYTYLAGFLFSTHPRVVQAAIAKHREAFDRNPIHYMYKETVTHQEAVREAAARYFGGDKSQYGLTSSTIMGAALVFNGIKIRPDQEAIVSLHDHPTVRSTLALRASKVGFKVNQIALYEEPSTVTKQQILERIQASITPKTRILLATWVHSGAGVKMPVREISEIVKAANQGRSEDDMILFCLDGVHATGIENSLVTDLGCDFFFAGTHKWLMGPRGTGIIWAKPEVAEQLMTTVPSLTGSRTFGMRMTPGGFQAFEHQFAAKEAFEFHLSIGKANIQERIYSLNKRLKDGLLKIKNVTVFTPMSADLSAGFVSFDIPHLTRNGKSVVAALESEMVLGSDTTYDRKYVRFSAGLLNNEEDIDRAIEVVSKLANDV